jgi:hypothetical protein
MSKVTLPDFKRIAETVTHKHFNTGVSLQQLIADELLYTFNQGYNLGKFDGYDAGRDAEWYVEQDNFSKTGVKYTGQV